MANTNQKYVRDLTVFPHPFSAAYWKMAAKEVTDLRTLIFAALIIAIRVALKQLFIPVGESLSIYIGFIFTAVGGSIYGPVMALIVGTITDLLGFVVAPTGAFNPLFTLVEVLSTFLYAIVLYRRKITFGRLLLAKLSVNVLANILLQSSIMALLYGKAFYVYVVPRILKNIVMLPFEVLVLAVIFGALLRPMVRLGLYSQKQNTLEMTRTSYLILVVLTVILLIIALMTAILMSADNQNEETMAKSLEILFIVLIVISFVAVGVLAVNVLKKNVPLFIVLCALGAVILFAASVVVMNYDAYKDMFRAVMDTVFQK